jgi:mono/diheme cytochrome c family protein
VDDEAFEDFVQDVADILQQLWARESGRPLTPEEIADLAALLKEFFAARR